MRIIIVVCVIAAYESVPLNERSLFTPNHMSRNPIKSNVNYNHETRNGFKKSLYSPKKVMRKTISKSFPKISLNDSRVPFYESRKIISQKPFSNNEKRKCQLNQKPNPIYVAPDCYEEIQNNICRSNRRELKTIKNSELLIQNKSQNRSC